MTISYTCDICGQRHDEAPLSWGPDAPDAWASLSPEEREWRGELGTDQCIIDDQRFFVRGRIEIPVIDGEEPFAWLVWAEVNSNDFLDMGRLWTVEGREETSPPYSGFLANELSLYPATTLGLGVTLHTRPVGVRPFFEIVQDHPLRKEQRNGITPHRVQQIADFYLS